MCRNSLYMPSSATRANHPFPHENESPHTQKKKLLRRISNGLASSELVWEGSRRGQHPKTLMQHPGPETGFSEHDCLLWRDHHPRQQSFLQNTNELNGPRWKGYRTLIFLVARWPGVGQKRWAKLLWKAWVSFTVSFSVNSCHLQGPAPTSPSPSSLFPLIQCHQRVCREGTKSQVVGLRFLFSSPLLICAVCVCAHRFEWACLCIGKIGS